jgi:hypothetical protein
VAFESSVSHVIPAGPQEISDAWLGSRSHENITGGQATQISTQVGADFEVWSGWPCPRRDASA